MSFTTICPTCGSTYILLERFRNHKIMCDDCDTPFLAHAASLTDLEIAAGPEVIPPTGWLMVCPACAHTQVVSVEHEGPAHCSLCDSVLAVPVTSSKKIRKKKKSYRKLRRNPRDK